MLKIYLSGGFHSGWQDRVKSEISEYALHSGIPLGIAYIDPRVHGLVEEELYTAWDLFGIDLADIVFVCMDKDNPGCHGIALEVGYAKAKRKLVVFVDEKDEGDPIKRYMGIARASADVAFDNLADGIAFVKSILVGMYCYQG